MISMLSSPPAEGEHSGGDGFYGQGMGKRTFSSMSAEDDAVRKTPRSLGFAHCSSIPTPSFSVVSASSPSTTFGTVSTPSSVTFGTVSTPASLQRPSSSPSTTFGTVSTPASFQRPSSIGEIVPSHGVGTSAPRMIEPHRVDGDRLARFPSVEEGFANAMETKSKEELCRILGASVFNTFADFTVAYRAVCQDDSRRNKEVEELRTKVLEGEGVRKELVLKVLEGEKVRKDLEFRLARECEASKSAVKDANFFRSKSEHAGRLFHEEGKKGGALTLALSVSVRERHECEMENSQLRERVKGLEGDLATANQALVRVGQLEVELGALRQVLAEATKSRRELLRAFPDMFRKLLVHYQVLDVLCLFHQAVDRYARHLACEDIAKVGVGIDKLPFFDPAAEDELHAIDAVFQAMAFPILDLLVRDLDMPVAELFKLIDIPRPSPPPT